MRRDLTFASAKVLFFYKSLQKGLGKVLKM